MPTPAERQALLFVAAVAALGVGVRGCRSIGLAAPSAIDRSALAAQIAAVDSAVTVAGARRPSTRLPPPSAKIEAPVRAPVNLDVAGVAELDLLPGIGPALANRIVADRAARGPFGSVKGLERVKGIGPSLAAKLQPHVTFSLASRSSERGKDDEKPVLRP